MRITEEASGWIATCDCGWLIWQPTRQQLGKQITAHQAKCRKEKH